MNLSYSKIRTYLSCPLNFRLTYVDRIFPRVIAYQKLGRVLHKTLRDYHRQAKRAPSTLEALLSFYSQYWGKVKKREIRQFKEGERILTNYFYENKDKITKPFMVEQRWKIPFDETPILGVFDRVDRHDGDFEIIEYKTARTIMSEDEIQEDLQLSLYQLASKFQQRKLLNLHRARF